MREILENAVREVRTEKDNSEGKGSFPLGAFRKSVPPTALCFCLRRLREYDVGNCGVAECERTHEVVLVWREQGQSRAASRQTKRVRILATCHSYDST